MQHITGASAYRRVPNSSNSDAVNSVALPTFGSQASPTLTQFQAPQPLPLPSSKSPDPEIVFARLSANALIGTRPTGEEIDELYVPDTEPPPSTWSPEAGALKDLLLAWLELPSDGKATYETAVLTAIESAPGRFTQYEKAELSALSSRLRKRWATQKRKDPPGDVGHGSAKQPKTSEAETSQPTCTPPVPGSTPTTTKPTPEELLTKALAKYRTTAKQTAIDNLKTYKTFEEMVPVVQSRIKCCTPQSLLTVANQMLLHPNTYPAEAPPLLYLLFLFAGEAPRVPVSVDDLSTWLPVRWPAWLGEGLRRDLLAIWEGAPDSLAKKQVKPVVLERYRDAAKPCPPQNVLSVSDIPAAVALGTPMPPSSKEPRSLQTPLNTSSLVLGPTTVQRVTNTTPASQPVPTKPQEGVPAMRTELTGEYGILKESLSAKMSSKPSERKPQLDQLRATFQNCASLALRDENLDAYLFIESLVHDWFRTQYKLLGLSLPPPSFTDPFLLLVDASSTLITQMKGNSIRLANNYKAPEGGETLTAPPPTPKTPQNS